MKQTFLMDEVGPHQVKGGSLDLITVKELVQQGHVEQYYDHSGRLKHRLIIPVHIEGNQYKLGSEPMFETQHMNEPYVARRP